MVSVMSLGVGILWRSPFFFFETPNSNRRRGAKRNLKHLKIWGDGKLESWKKLLKLEMGFPKNSNLSISLKLEKEICTELGDGKLSWLQVPC